MTQDILVDRGTDGLAVVTLNRPDKRNAINLAMWRGLKAIFEELGGDGAVRSIVLKGAGEHFSAGADISEFATVRATIESGTIYEKAEEDALLAVFHCNRPTIAQVSGYAIGGACALSCACDFRIADASAVFFIPAGRLGIVYSRLETELVLRQVGLANAKLILFSGDRVSATEAVRLGLINQLAEGPLEKTVGLFASRFQSNAPISLAGNKFILNALAAGEANDRHAEIRNWIHRSMQSEDYKEGQRAFREKRVPLFTGH